MALWPDTIAYSFQHMGYRVLLRATGDACLEDANAASAIDFIAAGYPGLCVDQSPQPIEIDNALIYRRWNVRDREHPSAPPEGLPRDAIISEAVEQVDHQERLLGRRVTIPQTVFGLIDRGPKLEVSTFLAWVLKIPVETLNAPGPGTPRERLEALEPYLDKPAVAERAAGTWSQIAYSEAHAHPEEFRPYIERFLASGQPARIAAALQTLRGMPVAEQAVENQIIELAFGPMLSTKDSLATPSIRAFFKNRVVPLPPDVRERAEKRLQEDETLTDDGRSVMYLMIACCHMDARDRAFDDLLALKGEAFEDTVRVISKWDLWASNTPQRWTSEELDQLTERATEVPSSRLDLYLFAFRMQASDSQKTALLALIHERLSDLGAAPDKNRDVIRQLQWLVEKIQKNSL